MDGAKAAIRNSGYPGRMIGRALSNKRDDNGSLLTPVFLSLPGKPSDMRLWAARFILG